MIKNLFLITNTTCNQSCTYCYYNIGAEKRIKGFLNPKLLKKFLDTKIRRISITGGEPLINPHLDEYLKIARGFSNNIALSTNGKLLTKEKIKYLKKMDVKRIFISLDDINANLQNKLRSDSKKSTLKAINYLKNSEVETTVTMVVTSYNIDNIFEVQEYCIRNNCKFWPQPIYLSKKSKQYQDFSLQSIGKKKWKKLINSVPKKLLNTKGAEFLKKYYKIFIDNEQTKNIQCPFKDKQLVINANGDIKLCFHSKPIANIKNRKLSQIVNAKSFQNNRKCFNEQCFQYLI